MVQHFLHYLNILPFILDLLGTIRMICVSVEKITFSFPGIHMSFPCFHEPSAKSLRLLEI